MLRKVFRTCGNFEQLRQLLATDKNNFIHVFSSKVPLMRYKLFFYGVTVTSASNLAFFLYEFNKDLFGWGSKLGFAASGLSSLAAAAFMLGANKRMVRNVRWNRVSEQVLFEFYNLFGAPVEKRVALAELGNLHAWTFGLHRFEMSGQGRFFLSLDANKMNCYGNTDELLEMLLQGQNPLMHSAQKKALKYHHPKKSVEDAFSE